MRKQIQPTHASPISKHTSCQCNCFVFQLLQNEFAVSKTKLIHCESRFPTKFSNFSEFCLCACSALLCVESRDDHAHSCHQKRHALLFLQFHLLNIFALARVCVTLKWSCRLIRAHCFFVLHEHISSISHALTCDFSSRLHYQAAR